LDDNAAAEFFRRSYTAVDGLWFVKLEERLGTEAALELDTAVWQIMPKIQARLLQQTTGAGSGLAALQLCLGNKLRWEGHLFQDRLDMQKGTLEIVIHECPWYQALLKSQRLHLAERIATHICQVEYPIWAAEFGPGLCFAMPRSICQGSPTCILHYSQQE